MSIQEPVMEPWQRRLAFLIMAGVCVLYGRGQELAAIPASLDDFYFLKRSELWALAGSHVAPIKEVLYPLFIQVPRAFGISLHLFETFCYGWACYLLWGQLLRLTRSRWAAWLTVAPLLLFPYQHPVFDRCTYDALQLILVPLTFATSIRLALERARPSAVLVAGLVAACQALTRPEGFLFIFPPWLALGWALKEAARTQGWRAQWAPALRKTGLLLLLPLASIELTCLANQCMFGFWGTTEIQSAPFQSCLRDLMAIQPSEVGLPRYVMVPRSSLKLAYAASPTFAKTEPYFEANLGGKGWSAYVSDPGQAGNIDGGHFEWALLDSAAFAAGGSPAAAGVFFKAVSRELDAALAGGGLPRRRLWLPMFGPGFTPWSWAGLDSLAKVGARDLDLSPGPLPKYALQDPDPQVEDDYNRLGSRASGVVTNGVWRASGWVLDPARGLPEKIALDPAAQAAGIQLRLIERKDVADAMLKNPAKARPLCGFQVVSPGSLDGNLVVTAPGRRYSVPISSLVTPGNGGAGGLHVQVDGMAGPHVPHLEAQTWVSAGVYLAMKFCLFLALGLGGVGLILRTRFPDAAWRRGAALVGMLAFSVAVPRLLLFACLDLSMCSGLEMRYMSAGVFSAWFFAAFTVAGLAVQIILRRNLFRVRAH